MRMLFLLALLATPIWGAELLNLSGMPLPRATLGTKEQQAIGGIKSAAEAIAILDAICVVAEPKAAVFLGEDYFRRETSINDTSARTMAILTRDERQQRAAKGRAERLTRALVSTAYTDSAGLATQGQIATTLRTMLRLAISADSGVRLEAQAWIRADARLQTAIDGLFALPRARRHSDFAGASAAVDFLLNKSSERSEDAFRALERFIAKYLT